MQTVSTIGLDIAKSVFQIHGVDANGVVVMLDIKTRYPIVKVSIYDSTMVACLPSAISLTTSLRRSTMVRQQPSKPGSGRRGGG
jgi:hypothetical protein